MTATTFPLDLSTFFDQLRITVLSFTLGEAMESSHTTGGEFNTAKTGNRLWQGEISVAPATHRDQGAAEAFADILRQPGASFYLYDPTHRAPAADPDSIDHNHAIATIGEGVEDMRQMTVTKLPLEFYQGQIQGFVPSYLTRGDHLSIELSGGRYSYHRIVTPTNGGTGNEDTPIEVVPFIPDSAQPGDRVRFVKPFLKAKVVPGSFSGGDRKANHAEGFRFRWQQTLG